MTWSENEAASSGHEPEQVSQAAPEPLAVPAGQRAKQQGSRGGNRERDTKTLEVPEGPDEPENRTEQEPASEMNPPLEPIGNVTRVHA